MYAKYYTLQQNINRNTLRYQLNICTVFETLLCLRFSTISILFCYAFLNKCCEAALVRPMIAAVFLQAFSRRLCSLGFFSFQ